MANAVNDLDYSSTVAKHRAIVRAFDDGMSIAKLVEEYKLTRRQIRRILKAGGRAQPTGRPKKILDSKIPELYLLITRKVESVDSLASKLNVSESTIRRKVKEYERSRSVGREITERNGRGS
jgi:Mor family transcriptional regulator